MMLRACSRLHSHTQLRTHLGSLLNCRNYSNTDPIPRVAVVGSGPAGFYTAQHILKGDPRVKVDIYEKLPVPFGLVRFGVAPDHPEVKNVINTFTKTASNERCSFYGNVSIGEDITLDELRSAYTAVILAYGADQDRRLEIPGEDLHGVMPARSFVGWYNGLPENSQLCPDLDTDTAIVLGQGNVAIDVARILLTHIDTLRSTDVPEPVLDVLSRSRVRQIVLVGRRGPLQVAFTTAELREMVRLNGCRPNLRTEDFTGLDASNVPQKRRRLTKLLMETALDPSSESVSKWQQCEREWALRFCLSPTEVVADKSGEHVAGLNFTINSLQGDNTETQKAVPTDKTEFIQAGLVFRSIGYKCMRLSGVEFDGARSVIPNERGRVAKQPGVYCSGWVKRGPIGVIVSTMNDAFETGKTVIDDLTTGRINASSNHDGADSILPALHNKGVQVVSFSDWQKIDAHECSMGNGKPREKLTDISKMLEVARI